MMSTPAIAALLGLNSALVLVGMIACTAFVPLTAPLFVGQFAGFAIDLPPFTFGLKLFGMLAGAVTLAILARIRAGSERIAKHAQLIDGLNVVVLFIFFVALLGDAGDYFYRYPMLVLEYTALAFGLTLVVSALTVALFVRWGWHAALALGLMASQRNMGLMLATAGALLSDKAWLYFALAQLPLYLLPRLLLPIGRKIGNA